MLRPRAVRELLIETAGLRRVAPVDEAAEGAAAPSDEAARLRELEALERARRRGMVAVGIDLAAIVLLLLLRESDRFLTLGRSEESIFTLGVLAVAVHLGYRLAQTATVGTVRRLHRELSERED